MSSVSNLRSDTRGQKWPLIWAHLLSCAVERDSANKHSCHVWGMLTVGGPKEGCHSPRQCALPRSKLLWIPGVLRGHNPRWAVHFLSQAGLRLWCSWQIWTIQGPRKTWLVTGGPLSLTGGVVLGGDCSGPLLSASGCCAPASLPPGRAVNGSRLALLCYLGTILWSFVLWALQVTVWH